MKTTIPEKERIYHFFDSGRLYSARAKENAKKRKENKNGI